MRYIDLEALVPPDGWVERADVALQQLREEIGRAEGEAVAAGEDPVEARRAAIRAGCAVASRRRVWRDLAASMAVLGDDKCWYSECKNPGSDKEVDHFRPKGGVVEDSGHEGYWWLAFDWRNLRYACQWCNQRRRDRVNETGGGKGGHFPLQAGSPRAYSEDDDYGDERPILLDPVDPNDWKLLTFSPDGRATPAREEGTVEHERARRSIDVYHLHCREMVAGRKSIATRIARVVREMEMVLARIAQPGQRGLYRSRVEELLDLIRADAEYSGAARAYARNQVLTLRNGARDRRVWLERGAGVELMEGKRRPALGLVQRVWSYAHVLKDDGLAFMDYTEQITYLLFLKMAWELHGTAARDIPSRYSWKALRGIADDAKLMERYHQGLRKLSEKPGMVGLIFTKPQSKIRDPAKLRLLMRMIEGEQWSSLDVDVKGDVYEGLLARNAEDVRGGAGQYFTPRPVTRAVVEVMRPTSEMTVADSGVRNWRVSLGGI